MTDIFSKAPGDLSEELRRYIERGIPPGSFLMSFLCNDLMHAVLCADDKNLLLLKEIALWFTKYAPVESYGSTEKVARWLGDKRKLTVINGGKGEKK